MRLSHSWRIPVCKWAGVLSRGGDKQAKLMNFFIPRLVTAALCAAMVVFSAQVALAQSGQLRPPEPPRAQTAQPADAAKGGQQNGQKVDEIAEAAAALNGPAGNAECVWLGRRVVSLLWRDDLDTALRHLSLYDRFGCPAPHIQATFRCVVRHGPFDLKAPESLNSRVHACWLSPGPAAAATPTPPAAAPPAPPAAATPAPPAAATPAPPAAAAGRKR